MTLTPTPINTVIIGGSAAGLASAVCLQQRGVEFVLLEKTDVVGNSWRNHYERLHLHTDKRTSALPHFPMPRDYPRYPSRQQVVDYLEAYAAHFQIPIEFEQTVVATRPSSASSTHRWEVETEDHLYAAQHVIVATGNTHTPAMPSWPGQQSFRGTIIHSRHYRNAQPFLGQRVLVVGFGNSAGEIALDLCENGVDVSMSVRSAVNVIPRDFFGLPVMSIAIAMDYLPPKLADLFAKPMIAMSVGDLRPYGLKRLPYGPNVQVRQDARNPILDIGTVSKIRSGEIVIRPDIAHISAEIVTFTDDTSAPFDTIVLATGYQARIDRFLQGADDVLDAKGAPRHSGVETLPGLYFCGYDVAATGILREIGIEAKRIAAQISA